MMNTFRLFLAVGACAVTGAALAQGSKDFKPVGSSPTQPGGGGSSNLLPPSSDDCSTATAISGLGSFGVDTTGATDSPQQTVYCPIQHNDVWFVWTAPASGCARISLCGGTAVDTVLAVYAGSICPVSGTELACSDDLCGVQSEVNFQAAGGASYMIQIGSYFAAQVAWVGTFVISMPAPALGNDDCGAPLTISGGGPFPYDLTNATTGCQGQENALCDFTQGTAIASERWFTWTATLTGTATFSNCGTTTPVNADTKVAIYDGAGCPALPAIACNDDATATVCAAGGFNSVVTWNTVCGHAYAIQLGRYIHGVVAQNGTFTVVESGSTCTTGTPFCFGDGTGTACPCGNSGAPGNGCASSVNTAGGNLAGSGTPSVSGDTLVLSGTGMPNSSALYFQGTTQISTPFGDGLRCAGGSVIRLGTESNAAGASQYPSGAELSVHLRGLDNAGDVRSYQCWYRNAAAFCTPSTFNLTNGFGVTWLP